jgi:hypothetical protein
MWQHFLALPLVARIITYAGLGMLAIWASLKSKAIHAIAKKATDTLSDMFWGWLRKKIMLPAQPQTNNERTYKGSFKEYWYSSVPRPMHFFKVIHNGLATTVPVWDTPMFIGLKPGTFVEVDTEALPGYKMETVKRVRVKET